MKKKKPQQEGQGASGNIFDSLHKERDAPPKKARKIVPMIDFDEQDAYIKQM